jgi:hypothetical protein
MKKFHALKSLDVFLREFSFVSGFIRSADQDPGKPKLSPQKGKNEDF